MNAKILLRRLACGLEFKWGYCLADWILGPMHAEKIKFVKEGRVPAGVKPKSIAYGAFECQIYLILRICLALFGRCLEFATIAVNIHLVTH